MLCRAAFFVVWPEMGKRDAAWFGNVAAILNVNRRPSLERIAAILNGFCVRLAVAHATGKVGEGDEEPAAVFFGQGGYLEGVVFKLRDGGDDCSPVGENRANLMTYAKLFLNLSKSQYMERLGSFLSSSSRKMKSFIV